MNQAKLFQKKNITPSVMHRAQSVMIRENFAPNQITIIEHTMNLLRINQRLLEENVRLFVKNKNKKSKESLSRTEPSNITMTQNTAVDPPRTS